MLGAKDSDADASEEICVEPNHVIERTKFDIFAPRERHTIPLCRNLRRSLYC